MELRALPGEFAVARLDPAAGVPEWSGAGALSCVTRTADELSIVCAAEAVPPGISCEPGWSCFQVQGPLAFSEIGILASLLAPIRDAGVSVFVVSTYDTDYVLVPTGGVERVTTALAAAGHAVR